MEQSKDFSVAKWIIFPALVTCFGLGIGYVSTAIFDVEGSIPTYLLLGVCLAISIVFIVQTGNKANATAIKIAFTFECIGLAALGITLIMSIIVLRQYTGAVKTLAEQNKIAESQGKTQVDLVKAIASLKSVSAQKKLAQNLKEPEDQKPKEVLTLEKIYIRAENMLLYPLVFEVGCYLLGLCAVFGATLFITDKSDSTETERQNSTDQNTRQSASLRQASYNAPFVRPPATRLASMKIFDVNNPDRFFTLNWQSSGWRVYDENNSYIKHISHTRYNANFPNRTPNYNEVELI